jgi:hypothetical protein
MHYSHNTVQLIVNGCQLMSLDSIMEFKKNAKELQSAIEGISVSSATLHKKMALNDRSFQDKTQRRRRKEVD